LGAHFRNVSRPIGRENAGRTVDSYIKKMSGCASLETTAIYTEMSVMRPLGSSLKIDLRGLSPERTGTSVTDKPTTWVTLYDP
jgi:hypothetical protein